MKILKINNVINEHTRLELLEIQIEETELSFP